MLKIFSILIIILVTFAILSPQKGNFAKDFSWVVGRLEFNPLEGGFWQIRFGSQADPYGGKFVLGNESKLAQFKDGDLVKITGKISPEQVSIYQVGTLYILKSIEVVK